MSSILDFLPPLPPFPFAPQKRQPKANSTLVETSPMTVVPVSMEGKENILYDPWLRTSSSGFSPQEQAKLAAEAQKTSVTPGAAPRNTGGSLRPSDIYLSSMDFEKKKEATRYSRTPEGVPEFRREKLTHGTTYNRNSAYEERMNGRPDPLAVFVNRTQKLEKNTRRYLDPLLQARPPLTVPLESFVESQHEEKMKLRRRMAEEERRAAEIQQLPPSVFLNGQPRVKILGSPNHRKSRPI